MVDIKQMGEEALDTSLDTRRKISECDAAFQNSLRRSKTAVREVHALPEVDNDSGVGRFLNGMASWLQKNAGRIQRERESDFDSAVMHETRKKLWETLLAEQGATVRVRELPNLRSSATFLTRNAIEQLIGGEAADAVDRIVNKDRYEQIAAGDFNMDAVDEESEFTDEDMNYIREREATYDAVRRYVFEKLGLEPPEETEYESIIGA